MIKVVTDSTCDLPRGARAEYDVTVVPVHIQFGRETYRDGVDLDRPAFYQKVEEHGTVPTTSQPSAGEFQACYERLADSGATDILSVHVTAKLSGTWQSAELARTMVADRVRVHTFDSACGSAGLGFMILEATRMALDGKMVPEIMERLGVLRERMSILFTMQDLRFAQMSGRVGKLQSNLASLLRIKPIVLLEGGLLDVTEKARTRSRAIDRVIDLLAQRVGRTEPVNLAVIHADVPDEGAALLERAKEEFFCQDCFVANLTTTLVVHFGPGTLGLIAYRV